MIFIQRPTKLDFSSNCGVCPVHISKHPFTPPQLECPKTITCATLAGYGVFDCRGCAVLFSIWRIGVQERTMFRCRKIHLIRAKDLCDVNRASQQEITMREDAALRSQDVEPSFILRITSRVPTVIPF